MYKGITKRAMAIILYEREYGATTANMIHVFMDELKLPSKNAARTYISMSKKALANKLDIPFASRKVDQRETKRGKCMQLFNDNRDLSRKEMVQLFVDKLDITQNSASTHCSLCVQEYSGGKHRVID